MRPQPVETLAASVNRPEGVAAILRRRARGAILTGASLLQRSSSGPFVRCLGGHYVFDDQRHDFERLIVRLRNLGEFITTGDLLDIMQGQAPLDGRYFHLSFDDGLASIWRNGVPILAEHEVPATLFINSAVVSSDAACIREPWERATNYGQSLSVMSWDQLRAAQSAGVEVGAHTRSHTRLSELSSDQERLQSEIAGCKRDIEDALGTPCRAFAWPYGTLRDIDGKAILAIRNAGYEAAFSLVRAPIEPGHTSTFVIPRHHFEPQWPWRHVKFFARGGMERPLDSNRYSLLMNKELICTDEGR
ncbi:polysaccharide deacetylase family protein [Roseovarius sp.]|uniref:polysaccharide deacetylase family protein n=1 Tax=Roseovarius sp. TaxID=1486281 RepID=UPI003562165E